MSKVQIEAPSADAWVSPDLVRPNPENPRIIFRQKELDALKQSIYEVGILQPLIVYQPKGDKKGYIIIDGERRWRCSRELNLQTIPVHIHLEPTPVQNLTMMFNIHKLRIDWELMPTAFSLKKLMELTQETRVGELSRMTGLSEHMVRKCLSLLSFSEKHQQMVLDHEIKDNLLLEIHPFIKRLSKSQPEILQERGQDDIVDSIIEKDKLGHLKSVVEIRDLSKIVDSEEHGAPHNTVKKIVSQVLDDPPFAIDKAYSLIRSIYDAEHLTTQSNRLADEIEEFSVEGLDDDVLKNLINSVARLMKSLHVLLEKLDTWE